MACDRERLVRLQHITRLSSDEEKTHLRRILSSVIRCIGLDNSHNAIRVNGDCGAADPVSGVDDKLIIGDRSAYSHCVDHDGARREANEIHEIYPIE